MLYKNSGTVKKDCKHLVKTYICISGFEEVKYMISADCTAEGFLFYLLFCYIRRKMTKFTSRKKKCLGFNRSDWEFKTNKYKSCFSVSTYRLNRTIVARNHHWE